jgi:hypothetical protein
MIRSLCFGAAALLAAALTGCATPPADREGETYQEPVYRTGSSLPVKDPSMRRGEVQDVSPEALRNSSPGRPAGGK